MGDWLRSGAETVSDWIPNEFSKTSNNWTGNIPYVGWVLRGLAGADNAAETYANGGSLGDAAQWGWHGFSGNAGDPNMYSEKNKAGMFGSGDPWLNIGQGVNLVPSQGGSDWMNYGNMASKGMGAMGGGQNSGGMNPMAFMNMFGGQQRQPQQKANGNGQFDMMMRSYLEQMLKQQAQAYQQPQQDQYPTQYQPQIEMGNNLYRPEVSGYQGAF